MKILPVAFALPLQKDLRTWWRIKCTSPLDAAPRIRDYLMDHTAEVCFIWLAAVIAVSALLVASPQAEAANYTFKKIADTADPEWLDLTSRPAVNNDGVVAFVGTREDGGAGNPGVFISNGNTLTTIADTATTAFVTFNGSPAINDNGDVAFLASGGGGTGIYRGDGASIIEISDGSNGIGEVSINNSGTVAFVGGSAAVFSGDRGSLTKIAREADGLRLFGTATINDSGSVGFSATISSSNINGVFESTDSGILRVIDNTGPIEGLSNVRFGYNNNGTVLVAGRLRGTGVRGLFASDGSDIRTLVSEEQGIDFYGFPNINDAEGILFTASLSSTGQNGIFTGPDPAIDALLLEGDEFLGKTVFAAPVIGRDSLNNGGQVAFLVFFTDGTMAIVRADPVSTGTTENLYFLNTEGGPNYAGRIERVAIDSSSGREFVMDVDPSLYGFIGDWKGFAADNAYYHFLNTEGGPNYAGRIERVAIDGSTGREFVMDVAPSLYGYIGDWKGFAVDENYFYFLNTEGGPNYAGRIERIAKDGSTGRELVLDVDPSVYGFVTDWKGFATDGQFFYFLNTQGGPNYAGRIDQLSMDGSVYNPGVLDVEPSLFGSIRDWKGFAATPVF